MALLHENFWLKEGILLDLPSIQPSQASASEIKSAFQLYALKKSGQTIGVICHDQAQDDDLFVAICNAIEVKAEPVSKHDEHHPCFVLGDPSEKPLSDFISAHLPTCERIQYFASLPRMKAHPEEKKTLWKALKPLRESRGESQ